MEKIFVSLTMVSLFLAACSGGEVVQNPNPVVTTGVCKVGQDTTADPFIDCVEDFSPAKGTTYGQDHYPQVIFDAPQGAGATQGSLDVLSLGCGGSITVFFDDPAITDGPGADFTVFENAFKSGLVTFTEPAQVSVSEDGKTWYAYACDVTSVAATGCAGKSPVYANSQNGISAHDPNVSGGDSYDLSESGLSMVRYVKLEDKTKQYYDAQGLSSSIYCGANGGFDLDSIAAIHTK